MRLFSLLLVISMSTPAAFAGETVILDGLINEDKVQGLSSVLELYCDSAGQAKAVEQSFARYKTRVAAGSKTNELHPTAYQHTDGPIIIRDTRIADVNASCENATDWCYTIPSNKCSWTEYLK